MGSLTVPSRSRNLQFFTNPALWPSWPFLPVVRRHADGRQDLGVLFDALGCLNLPGYSSTVFATNLFAMPRTLDEFLTLPRETFDTPEEVCQAGWGVD